MGSKTCAVLKPWLGVTLTPSHGHGDFRYPLHALHLIAMSVNPFETIFWTANNLCDTQWLPTYGDNVSSEKNGRPSF